MSLLLKQDEVKHVIFIFLWILLLTIITFLITTLKFVKHSIPF